MLDSLGESFLRHIVRAFDNKHKDQQKDLADAMHDIFRFGDENLRHSLAVVLCDYFKREARSTVLPWQWLKGEKAKFESLGVRKTLADPGDMVFTVLNLGNLARDATGQGIL